MVDKKEEAKKKRLKNIKPWKKGQSGNPKGYKKGVKNRKTIIKKFLEATLKGEKLPYDIEGEVKLEDILVLAMIKKAKGGDVKAYQELMDSVYGKIPDVSELTGADGEPLIPIINKGRRPEPKK